MTANVWHCPFLGPGAGIGGGEVTSSIPVGGSTLNINVTSEGRVGQYTVELARGLTFPCTEQGVFDAFAFADEEAPGRGYSATTSSHVMASYASQSSAQT